MKAIAAFIAGSIAGFMAGWVAFSLTLGWAERVIAERLQRQAEIETGAHLRLIDGDKQ